MVRALVCGTRGRWFKSTRLYHFLKVPRKENAGGFAGVRYETLFGIQRELKRPRSLLRGEVGTARGG